MDNYVHKFKAFSDKFLYDYLHNKITAAQSHIQHVGENYILNVNETEYINYLVEETSVEMINIDYAAVSIETYETAVSEGVYRRPAQAIIYYLPFTGDPELLNMASVGNPNIPKYF